MAKKRKCRWLWISTILTGVFFSLVVSEQVMASAKASQIACGDHACTLICNKEENWLTLTEGSFAGDYTALKQALDAESIRIYYATSSGEMDGNLRTGDIIQADGVEY